MTKYLAIAFLITGFLVGNAYGDNLIADVHFDDGSVLHNAKLKPNTIGHGPNRNDPIVVEYENEYFELNFKDLKTLEVEVEKGTNEVRVCLDRPFRECGYIGTAAIVTLKIKTKTGLVVSNRFSSDGTRNRMCREFSLPILNKLTGKEVTKSYGFTNLGRGYFSVYLKGSKEACVFQKGKRKGISSIVFKDGNKKIEEIKK